MIAFDNRWVWDFWLAHDGQRHHIYYLSAPRSLGAEERRHRAASIEHSSSVDLVDWDHHGTVLGLPPGAADRSRWTGSVVRRPDGGWLMFYTEAEHRAPEPRLSNVQTVSVAVSPDLHTWSSDSRTLTRADARWYETFGTTTWPEEAWRDPWVCPRSDGNGWDMLVTARSLREAGVPDDDAGVVGHAWSPDLTTWQVSAPLSRPGSGFGHLEVPQLADVHGTSFLVFSCGTGTLSRSRQLVGTVGGTWSVPVEEPLSTVDADSASLLLDERYYSGRIVQDPTLGPVLMAVCNRGDDGSFVGTISDPMPLSIGADGLLSASSTVADARHPAR